MNETPSRILVVDDEPSITEFVGYALKKEGFQPDVVDNGEDALAMAQENDYDLFVLDIMLPGMDGYELCRRLRTKTSAPVLFLSARDTELGKVVGLEIGGDDYLAKPFGVRELIARVKALLRRAAPQNEEEGILHVGGLTIDVGNYEAFRNGEKLSLTLKEFELLKLLVLSRGKVLTRDFLLDRIWGYEFYGETRTVDVHIRHIRQKLGDDAHYIETIRGVGYKFNDRQENRL